MSETNKKKDGKCHLPTAPAPLPEEDDGTVPCGRCGKNPAEDEHPCPYDVEMSPDGEGDVWCTCCGDCEYQCAMDI